MGFLLDILLPRRCLGCGRVGEYVCFSCRRTLRAIIPSDSVCPVCQKRAIGGATHPVCRGKWRIDGLTAFFLYWGVLRRVLKTVKYRSAFDVAGRLMALVPLTSHNLIPLVKNGFPAILVPIPLHLERQRLRGFNQSELFGRIFASAAAVQVEPGILTRFRMTVPQADLSDRKRRLANIRGVFRVNKPIADKYIRQPVILFDDVYTTGATLSDAAATLKRSGFRFVWGVVLAR